MPIPVQTDPYYETQVVLRPDTNPNSNTFINRWFFKDNDTTPRSESAVAASIKTILDNVYNQTHTPGTAALAASMSGVIDPTLTVYKTYDLRDAAPRIPIQLSASSWTVSTTAYPNEVALVLSYRSGSASLNGGSSDPTKRGRIYFGPLGTTGTYSAGDDDLYPNSATINKLVGIGTYLTSHADMVTQKLLWVQYSLKLDRFQLVTGGFVDQRFDTQRRRGGKTLTRTTW